MGLMLAEREEPRFVDTCGEKRSRQGYYFYVVDDIAIWSNNFSTIQERERDI